VDPLRIAIRILLVYVVLRVFVRISGKRAVKHASPFDFTVALIIGDMMDDAIWAEVGASVFAVGVGVLMITHIVLDYVRFRMEASR